MEKAEVDRVLSGAEQTLAKGERVDLRRLGFWRAVEAVKARPEWIEAYADRISAIDRQAFRRETWIAVPLNPGLVGLATAMLIGLALVGGAFIAPPPVNGIMILAGAGALLAATHDLAHWAVGRAIGIQFTEFVRPTESSPARARVDARVGRTGDEGHPFALIPVAFAARTPRWVPIVLALLGLAQIATDVLFSTKTSDWKRFRRGMRNARTERGPVDER